MTNDDFRIELHEYVDGCYDAFLNYQSIVIDILKVFIDICDENGIMYFMGYGSLIGAVRDKGSIPWDYDIDVMVPLVYRGQLLKVLDSRLSATDYFYAYSNNMKEYSASCLRMCKKGLPFNAIHLDVFFLVGCPSDGEAQKKYMIKMNRYCNITTIRDGAYWMPTVREQQPAVIRILRKIRSSAAHILPGGILNWYENKLMNKYPYANSEYCCSWGETKYKKAFKTRWFSQAKQVELFGKKTNIPVDYEEYLSALYRDYQRYPAVESRFDEWYTMLHIINQRVNKSNYEKDVPNTLFNGNAQD